MQTNFPEYSRLPVLLSTGIGAFFHTGNITMCLFIMVIDSLKGVSVPDSVCLMWRSTISMDKNFLVMHNPLKTLPHAYATQYCKVPN